MTHNTLRIEMKRIVRGSIPGTDEFRSLFPHPFSL